MNPCWRRAACTTGCDFLNSAESVASTTFASMAAIRAGWGISWK